MWSDQKRVNLPLSEPYALPSRGILRRNSLPISPGDFAKPPESSLQRLIQIVVWDRQICYHMGHLQKQEYRTTWWTKANMILAYQTDVEVIAHGSAGLNSSNKRLLMKWVFASASHLISKLTFEVRMINVFC